MLLMIGVVTVSATDNNISGEVCAPDITTHDTVNTLYQSTSMVKEETKNMEMDDIEQSGTDGSKTIQKDTTTNTKSADEPTNQSEVVKKEHIFIFNGDNIR